MLEGQSGAALSIACTVMGAAVQVDGALSRLARRRSQFVQAVWWSTVPFTNGAGEFAKIGNVRRGMRRTQ